ncbi:chorismate mutase [Litoribacter populi]|uniref:chorismate mutase n=1 Tax=Litoribacter populi TaxID=2598460 RepID=UPI00118144BA|nr:chorismate mutase [Litoribacter populi]
MKNHLQSTEWGLNLTNQLIIAGPCSAESPGQIEKVCLAMKEENVLPSLFRAGIWKPRTRPGSFEGIGEEGLKWMEIARHHLNVPITTEVGNAAHVEMALKHKVDVLWIGARTTVNPFAVQEIAEALRGTDIPVMVKNPMNPDLQLWIGALERLHAVGINKLAAIHRGFSDAYDKRFRNKPNWSMPIHLKREWKGMQVINDPSHIVGKRDGILETSQRALNFGLDGLMIETHHDPDKAWSDAKQQVTPAQLKQILQQLDFKTPLEEVQPSEKLHDLRAAVDHLDDQLLDILAERFAVIEQIGAHKRENHLSVFQSERWKQVMDSRTQKGVSKNLGEKFMKELLFTIHEESVKRQEKQLREQVKIVK